MNWRDERRVIKGKVKGEIEALVEPSWTWLHLPFPSLVAIMTFSIFWVLLVIPLIDQSVATGDSLSPYDLMDMAGLLEDNDSPPLSAEGGVTILGTGAVDPATTLDCHRRLYSYRVTKTDSLGRKCWGHVNVMSCWGRCDSNEIPDWKFPYKRSHHPVCTYGSRKPNFATLSNCDPDIEPGTERYDYQEAESCVCTVCKSSEASCEGLRYRGIRSGFN